MNITKILSLFIATLYVVAFIWSFASGPERVGPEREKYFENLYYIGAGMLIWLGLSLGCIWWGDELGEGLIGAKCGLVSSPSPGWAVKLIGWIILALPAVIAIYIRFHRM